MPQYKIMTGEIDCVITADTVESAVIKAIQDEQAGECRPLGMIVEIIEVADGPWYMSTEMACKAAGCWADESPLIQGEQVDEEEYDEQPHL